jgi:pteridine reductase
MPNPARVALVTGGAKRVGRAIAERLARAGFDLVVTYHRSADEARSLARGLESAGRKVITVQADLADPAAAVPRITAAVNGTFGGLDVLVNNASVYEESALASTNLDQMRRFWSVHVESPLLLCRDLAPFLRQSRGHVVNMLDLLAERPWPRYLAYSASKGALWTLTLGLARELAPEVTVNGIAPGVVAWPDDMPQEERERYLKRVPLARSGTPADVADLVLYLCTAGSYVTGQVIRLDGGRSIT